MATRDLKTPGLAKAAAVPYGTMRKILELNTVADYEQLRRIAIALSIPLSDIVADAERLVEDPGVRDDYERAEHGRVSLSESAPQSTALADPAGEDVDALANGVQQTSEDIDIDAWADRIKAEDSVHNN